MSRLGREKENIAFGQLAWMVPPSSLFYVHDTKDEPLNVEIGAVNYFPDRVTDRPRNRRGIHWLLRWHVKNVDGNPYFRVIEIRVEKQDDESKRTMGVFPEVYTNWGPKTRSVTNGDTTLWISLGALSLDQRRRLEDIAAAEHVRYPGPNDPWNCQDWLKTVLHKATRAKIFSAADIHYAYAMLEGNEALNAWIAKRSTTIHY